MNKTLVIQLIAKVIQDASENGKNFSWMFKPNNSLDELCNELDVSNEEITDIVQGLKYDYFVAPYTERSEAMFEADDFRLKDKSYLIGGQFKYDNSVQGWQNGEEIGIFIGVNSQRYVVFSDFTVKKWEDMPQWKN